MASSLFEENVFSSQGITSQYLENYSAICLFQFLKDFVPYAAIAVLSLAAYKRNS